MHRSRRPKKDNAYWRWRWKLLLGTVSLHYYRQLQKLYRHVLNPPLKEEVGGALLLACGCLAGSSKNPLRGHLVGGVKGETLKHWLDEFSQLPYPLLILPGVSWKRLPRQRFETMLGQLQHMLLFGFAYPESDFIIALILATADARPLLSRSALLALAAIWLGASRSKRRSALQNAIRSTQGEFPFQIAAVLKEAIEQAAVKESPEARVEVLLRFKTPLQRFWDRVKSREVEDHYLEESDWGQW